MPVGAGSIKRAAKKAAPEAAKEAVKKEEIEKITEETPVKAETIPKAEKVNKPVQDKVPAEKTEAKKTPAKKTVTKKTPATKKASIKAEAKTEEPAYNSEAVHLTDEMPVYLL